MNVLFTGRGGAGSWDIRGTQLAAAMECTATHHATYPDVLDHDLVVVVKKIPSDVLRYLRLTRKPWVFDALDFYPQPLCTHWQRDEAIAWVQAQIKQLNPTAVLWPNQRMRDDCDDGRPGLVLYHHHRPGLEAITVASKLRTVAYEGAEKYLGQWTQPLTQACKTHGAKFLFNVASMRIADAVVAVRDKPFSGYAQFHWKSNVKLANAQAMGAVFVGQPECGYKETSTGAELWVNNAGELNEALQTLAPQAYRQSMQAKALSAAYTVQQAAKDLKGFLRGL